MTHLGQCRRLVVPFLGQEDLLEGDMATHSPILARKQKSLMDYSPWGRKKSTGLRMHLLVRSHVRTAAQLSPLGCY